MTTRFNKVVILPRIMQPNNIWLMVHPFDRKEDGIRMMMRKGDYDAHFGRAALPEWQARLADQLWDGIPALDNLFFDNGHITLQHGGVFSDDEIIEAATEIIRPALEANLLLMQLALPEGEDDDPAL